MKAIVRALKWSIGLELILLTPLFLGRILQFFPFDFIFGVLTYLVMFSQAPAWYLLDHWPSAQQTLLWPSLVQWLILFVMFAAIFTLAAYFRQLKKGHDIRVC
jgi:hypothetical protein